MRHALLKAGHHGPFESHVSPAGSRCSGTADGLTLWEERQPEILACAIGLIREDGLIVY